METPVQTGTTARTESVSRESIPVRHSAGTERVRFRKGKHAGPVLSIAALAPPDARPASSQDAMAADAKAACVQSTRIVAKPRGAPNAHSYANPTAE